MLESDVERHREESVMTGQVEFYDEACAWGLIRGDDGRLYELRGAQLPGPPPREGDHVLFDPQPAPGGPRAQALRRAAPVPTAAGTARP
jgi:cold shock CspA family protein